MNTIETATTTTTTPTLESLGVTAEKFAAMMARMEALEAKNAELAGVLAAQKKLEDDRRRKALEASVKAFKDQPIKFEVTEKGCLKVSNLGPGTYGGVVALYPWTWEKLLGKAGAILGALGVSKGLCTLEEYIERQGLEKVVAEFDPNMTAGDRAAAMVAKGKRS